MEKDKKESGQKPAPNHPWRKLVPAKVRTWAREQSGETVVNNYLKGGGIKRQ